MNSHLSEAFLGHDVATFMFAFANAAITAGYFFLALAIVPKIKLSLRMTKIGGVGFFLLCGLTHMDMAIHTLFEPDVTFGEMATEPHMLLIHVPQAITVWMFVLGLYIELVRWGPWANDHRGDR